MSTNINTGHPSAKTLGTMRYYLLVLLVINLAVIIIRVQDTRGLGSLIFGYSGSTILWSWPYFLFFIILAAALIMSDRGKDQGLQFAFSVYKYISAIGLFNWVFFGLLIAAYGYYRLAGLDLLVLTGINQLWLFGHLGVLGAIFLTGTQKIRPIHALLASFSIFGMSLWVISFIPDVQAYPLSLGWSEASRYYYASLFFSPWIYGSWAPLSSLHPSRYLMQSAPFIIPALPIWFHRLWQVLLWLGMTFAGGAALVHRFNLREQLVKLGLAAWFFLFINQGPVYYHLMVMVVLILLCFEKRHLGRSLIYVMIASLWAGISRVNWFPVPGMLAVALYVLEIPQGEKGFWQYWRWPILAVLIGFLLAFVSQAGYVAISGNPPEVFASSFTSPLFFYRLLPNEIFGPGIINMAITASFPVWVILTWRILPNLRAWGPLRMLALLSILVTLLIGGFVVSMKIGGGNNLHNMDAYLVLLAVVGVYIEFNHFVPDHPEKLVHGKFPVPLLVVAFLVPLIFALDQVQPYPDLDDEIAWQDIARVESLIDTRVSDGGEVLFIQSRHLLTFDLISDVTLVSEYEKVFLMEMAMSNNEAYLGQFRQDLEAHRFDLIVAEPLSLVIRPENVRFGEENNVWVARVAYYLDAHYHSILELEKSAMSILVPKPAE